MIAAILIVVAVTFALRLIPAALWPGDSSDAGYHLLLRRVIRENGMKMPRKVAAMGLDEAQRYPWFYHTLIACLPERLLLRCPALVSAVSDSFMALLAMLLLNLIGPEDMRGNAPLIAGLLVATSPALLAAGVGPRSYEVTPRAIGELFFSAALVLAGYYLYNPKLWLLASAVVLLGLSFLSSKFTVQVAVFCLPVMALLGKMWLPLALLAAGFIAAVVLSGGRWLGVLRAQLHHLDIYRRRIMYDHDATQYRNDTRIIIADIAQRWRAAKNLRETVFMTFVTLEKFTILLGLARNLVWILVAVMTLPYLWQYESWLSGDWWRSFITPPFGGSMDLWMHVWMLAPLAPFVLTSLRPFLFLGEAERYMEYAVLPAVYYFALMHSNSLGFRGWLVVAFTLAFLAYTWRRMKMRKAKRTGDEESLVGHLASLPDGQRILPLSQGLGFRLVWRLKHIFLISIDGVVWRRDYDQLFYKYPWVSTDLGWWIREKGAALLVVDHRQLAAMPHIAAKYDLSPYPVAYRNDTFEVRRLAA